MSVARGWKESVAGARRFKRGENKTKELQTGRAHLGERGLLPPGVIELPRARAQGESRFLEIVFLVSPNRSSLRDFFLFFSLFSFFFLACRGCVVMMALAGLLLRGYFFNCKNECCSIHVE